MSLTTALPVFISEVQLAYMNAKNNGFLTGAQPEKIAMELAKEISNAIKNYAEKAQVNTVDIIPAGQEISLSPSTQKITKKKGSITVSGIIDAKNPPIGTTASVGSSTGTGKLTNLLKNIKKLESNFFLTFKNSYERGAEIGADPKKIISDLAQEMAIAIQIYVESLTVETDHLVSPGQPTVSSTFAVGIVSTPGKGKSTASKVSFLYDKKKQDEIGPIPQQLSALVISKRQSLDVQAENSLLKKEAQNFNDYIVLKKAIENAYLTSAELGSQTGVNSDNLIFNLSSQACLAIQNFFMKAIVSVEISVSGGETVTGHITQSGAPIPAYTVSSKGVGSGNIV